MNSGYPNPSQDLTLFFKINRQARIRWTITVDDVAANTTGWTWQLFIKQFAGARLNIINLTLGNGLRYEIYSDTILVADFSSAQANLEEGEYYYELVRTDIETTWVEGKAFFQFAKTSSDTVETSNFTINVDSAGTPVTLAIASSQVINIAGADTLQDAYDNGDGTISLLNGKPLIIYNADQSQAPLQLDHLGNLTVVGNDNTSLIELRVGAITDTYLLMSKTALAIVSSGNVSIKGKTMTTVGGNIFSIANPSALKLIRTKADNTVEVIDPNEFIGVACSDETTVLAAASTSVPVATFHAPYALTLTRVFAGLRTAGTGAAVVTVDIHVNGTTIMSATKILFTASVKLSADGVLTTTSIAAGDYVEIFLDQRDTNNVATGLKAYLVGYKT